MKKLILPVVSFVMACTLLRAQGEPSPTPDAPPDFRLESVLGSPEFWQTSPADLELNLKDSGFEWTSASKDTLRLVRPGATFAGHRTWETLIRFSPEKPHSATVIFYNRGDAGDLGEEEFVNLLKSIQDSLSKLTGLQPEDLGRNASGAVKAQGLAWNTGSELYTLEWSATKAQVSRGIPFRAEFIRLTQTPATTEKPRVGATPPPSTKDIVKSFRGADKVTKTPEGDVVLLDVPMVDQGQKGYCVVASVERVMRYFGADVDQHELAQIADSDSSRGTNPDTMLDSLKKLTMRLGVRVREVQPFSFRDFLDMIKSYNRAAKRSKTPEVSLEGRVIDITEVYARMDRDIFREVRMKNPAGFGRFERDVQRSVQEGLPLLWSVQLGMVREPGLPQVQGGHMRLIIGYNSKTGEILYSDSWGMGHELKRMPMEDAFLITHSLAVIQPTGS